MPQPTKVLILSLGRRGGSVRYGTSLIEEFTIPKEVYVSKYCTEKTPQDSIAVKTYRNKAEFILNSILILPGLWFRILWGLKKGYYSALYTPYTHYWNLLFILTFKVFQRPTFSTVHDGIPHTGDGNLWERVINYAILRKSDHLIFLTKHVYHYLKSKIGFRAQCHISPHGPIQIEGCNTQRDFSPAPLKILFLGRVCHYKGVDLLIESLKALDTNVVAQCLIAGEVHENQKHLKEETLIIPLIWKDHWQSDAEMAQHLNTSDLLILPYREATQSGVMSIGISTHMPMLSTNAGGLAEQCTTEQCYYVEPTPEAIAKGIRELHLKPELREKFSENLKARAKELHWNNLSSAIQKIILGD